MSRMGVPYVLSEHWNVIRIWAILLINIQKSCHLSKEIPPARGYWRTLLKKGKRRRGGQTWRARPVNLHVWRSHGTCCRSNTLTHERTRIWLPKRRQTKTRPHFLPPSKPSGQSLGSVQREGKRWAWNWTWIVLVSIHGLTFQTGLDFFYTEVTRKWWNQPKMLRKQLTAKTEDKVAPGLIAQLISDCSTDRGHQILHCDTGWVWGLERRSMSRRYSSGAERIIRAKWRN